MTDSSILSAPNSRPNKPAPSTSEEHMFQAEDALCYEKGTAGSSVRSNATGGYFYISLPVI